MSKDCLDKVFTLIGFAYRAKNVVIGIDAIQNIRHQNIYLTLVSSELSENSMKKLSEDKIVFDKEDWGKIIFSTSVKAILIKDKNINRVIKDCYESIRREV